MSRNYRGDVELSVIDWFMPLLMEKEDEGQISPVLFKNGISFVYVKHMNIFCKSFCSFFYLELAQLRKNNIGKNGVRKPKKRIFSRVARKGFGYASGDVRLSLPMWITYRMVFTVFQLLNFRLYAPLLIF